MHVLNRNEMNKEILHQQRLEYAQFRFKESFCLTSTNKLKIQKHLTVYITYHVPKMEGKTLSYRTRKAYLLKPGEVVWFVIRRDTAFPTFQR